MLISLLLTLSSSVFILVNTFIYLAQLLKTRLISITYSILTLYILGSKLILGVYMQSLSIEFLLASYTLPDIELIPIAYI